MRRTSTFAVARARVRLRVARSQAIRYPAPAAVLRLGRRGLIAPHERLAWVPGDDRFAIRQAPRSAPGVAPDRRRPGALGEDPAERHEGRP